MIFRGEVICSTAAKAKILYRGQVRSCLILTELTPSMAFAPLAIRTLRSSFVSRFLCFVAEDCPTRKDHRHR